MGFGHLQDMCPYEDPLWRKAYWWDEVDSAEDWFRLMTSQPATFIATGTGGKSSKSSSSAGLVVSPATSLPCWTPASPA
ncbi:UNVERIFIED_CONTAM: hypothetical protein FKN15_061857 [Acipenser sinensis]